jgi:regulator of RNase E activity RraA
MGEPTAPTPDSWRDPSLVARLGRLDACALSDAMDALGLDGVITGLRPMSAGRRIAGQAITVRLVPAAGGPTSKVHLGAAAITAALAGDIVVVANDGRTEMASWGGLLSLAATIKGIAGIVVDGAVRDVDESVAFNLPVFARCSVPRTARTRVVEAETNGPVTLAGIEVRRGDFVLADGTGVVSIPADQAALVISRAEIIAAKERAMAAALYAGQPIVDVMGANYEHMLEEVR